MFSRKLGELYVNGKPFAGLPALRQYILPRIVGHEEGKDIKTVEGIQDLFVVTKGANLVYRVKGVVFEIETGENVAVPIWLLSDKDRKVIEPLWNAWAAAEKDVKHRDRIQEEQSTLARATFNEHQRNHLAENQLQFLLSAAHWNQLPQALQLFKFEVGLTRPGGLHTTVTITANNELAARNAAEQQYPHCHADFSRRIRLKVWTRLAYTALCRQDIPTTQKIGCEWLSLRCAWFQGDNFEIHRPQNRTWPGNLLRRNPVGWSGGAHPGHNNVCHDFGHLVDGLS